MLSILQALEIIPYTLAENAGINPIQMVTELRNRHNGGLTSAGINVREGVVSDMWALKVVQPLLVNTSEIALATECVGMILKIGKILILIFFT
jgi:T-complex protein 1 subunit delta